MQVRSDSVATIAYTMRDEDGALIEASPDDHPLVLLMGRRTLFPALEEALIGLAVGDQLDARLPPGEAYGFHDDRLVQRIPRERFGGSVEVGMQFEARSAEGRRHVARVLALEGDEVVVDANHPLAGKTLLVTVQVLELRAARPEELDHGHVHPHGGCGSPQD